MTRPHRLLSLAAAQRELGLPGSQGRRLLRILQAKERQHRRRIMVRVGAGREHRRVTLAALRRWCPELFPGRAEELRQRFGDMLRSLDERIDARVTEQIDATVSPHIEEIREHCEVNSEAIRELAVRIARSIGGPAQGRAGPCKPVRSRKG